MFGVQTCEQLDHHPGNPGADLEKVVSESDLVEHLLNVGVSGEPVAFKGRSDRCAEQQIDGNRRIGVVKLRVETLDEMSKSAGFETPGNRQRHAVEVGVANAKAPARRGDEPGKELRDEISAAVALADDCYIGAEREVEIDLFEQRDAVIVHHTDIGRSDLAMQRFELLRRFEQQAFVEHIRNLELLDDLLVFDRHVLLVLIEVKQLLPRRRYVLIGGKHRDQRAERELALDHKISADQEKQERRRIADHIVEKVYEEVEVIDLYQNIVDFSLALIV